MRLKLLSYGSVSKAEIQQRREVVKRALNEKGNRKGIYDFRRTSTGIAQSSEIRGCLEVRSSKAYLAQL
jgi:hypothetical protein